MRLIMLNISKRYFLLLTFTVFWILSGCEQSTSPELKPLIANAGPDQTTQVGSYAILDGSGSSPDDGEGIVWYEWIADENNPQEVAVFSGDADSIQAIGFTKEGIYKFTLVVNNGIQDSEPDEVVVTVNPRDNVIFEDPSLEVHVRYALKKPTEELTETVLLSLDSLHFVHVQIVDEVTSLNGIEHCANLKYLGMNHQRITDLSPLANLIQLTKLELSQNYTINDILPLAYLTELRHLNLRSNQIADISPLEDMTKLIYLNIMYNPISDISMVANLNDLEELWLSHSPIGDISPLAELKQLSLLWMSACQITDITSLANLKNLHKIYLDGNQISDISPLEGMTQLEWLYLDENQIVDISPLENLVNLTRLRLWDNQISDILPLVNNSGLGDGDYVGLCGNPLNETSINEYIPILRARGVHVHWP